MGLRTEPDWVDYPDDTEQEVYCGRCDDYHLMTVQWDNVSGLAVCPECGDSEIEVDYPEPDYEAITERREEDRAERLFREP